MVRWKLIQKTSEKDGSCSWSRGVIKGRMLDQSSSYVIKPDLNRTQPLLPPNALSRNLFISSLDHRSKSTFSDAEHLYETSLVSKFTS